MADLMLGGTAVESPVTTAMTGTSCVGHVEVTGIRIWVRRATSSIKVVTAADANSPEAKTVACFKSSAAAVWRPIARLRARFGRGANSLVDIRVSTVCLQC
jgi:hypothetical protein